MSESRLPQTELESINELIFDLEERVSQLNEEINQYTPEDPQINFLTLDLEKFKARLEFMKGQREEVISSGVTRYRYAFGSIEDIQQDFETASFHERFRPEDQFTFKVKWILEKDTTPSKKIKMLNNLVQVYEQYSSFKA